MKQELFRRHSATQMPASLKPPVTPALTDLEVVSQPVHYILPVVLTCAIHLKLQVRCRQVGSKRWNGQSCHDRHGSPSWCNSLNRLVQTLFHLASMHNEHVCALHASACQTTSALPKAVSAN
jgi:hypothetical protein